MTKGEPPTGNHGRPPAEEGAWNQPKYGEFLENGPDRSPMMEGLDGIDLPGLTITESSFGYREYLPSDIGKPSSTFEIVPTEGRSSAVMSGPPPGLEGLGSATG